MRSLVTPTFSEKATSAGAAVLEAAGKALSRIEVMTKEELLSSAELVLDGTPSIYALKDKNYRVLFTFGTDDQGEYALLADLVVHGGGEGLRPLGANNPRTNMLVDPSRNMMIDPTRNMMIDPRRNMMVDPHRNMMIDPRRNMMIDPKRNMMLDVRRNMMIDPARNFSIDPKRNWQINPTQNSVWDGPLLFDLQNNASGFVVRATEQVALLFNQRSEFVSAIIRANDKNWNLFDRDGSWTGFLVHNGAEGFNQFDVQNRWIGFLVGELDRVDA